MRRSRKLLDSVLDAVQLEAELQPGISILELAGDQRVLIEKHRSVACYSPEKIIVCTEYGCLCLTGCNLLLRKLGREQIIVTGWIDCITIQRKAMLHEK